MKAYPPTSRSCVATMQGGDFYGSEQSTVMEVIITSSPDLILTLIILILNIFILITLIS